MQVTNDGRRMDYIRAKAAARWRGKLARAAFDTWDDQQRSDPPRNQLRRAVAKFKHRVANAAFANGETWCRGHKVRVLLRRVARMKNKCVVTALDAWKQR